jgi:hypothetical protein
MTDEGEEPVLLSPFVVNAAEDTGSYRATATLAGTRIRTELKDVGSAISVVTAQFLQDTGARNTEDLLVYTTNTEVGGSSGNFANTGGRSDTTEGRLRPHENTRVRGLTRADNTRDFFLTDIPWDSYNVGRVDIQRGANAILFGLGSPAGIVNASLNSASFRDSNTVEGRFGSYGTYRGSIDINKVLLDDELAIRVAGLNDKTFYRQDPAYSHNTRAYGAVMFDPMFLRKGSARTSIRANYEKGEIDANRPRITAPRDAITPWFDPATSLPGGSQSFAALNKRTFDAASLNDTSPEALAANPNAGVGSRTINSQPNPRWSPYVNNGAGGQIYDQVTTWFNEPGTTTQGGVFMPSMTDVNQLPTGVSFPWTVYMGISPHLTAANYLETPGTSIGAVRNYTVNDRRIFDSFNHLIDGPNKRELTDFEAFNIAVSQTFLDNRLGFEVAYDVQEYHDEVNQLLGGDPLISVDIMSTLPDGRVNANAGRAFVAGAPNSSNGRWTDRETLRVTGFGELNFKDIMRESKLASFLGRHVFTGLYSDQERDVETRNWYNFAHGQGYRTGQNTSIDSRRVNSIHYLSPNLSNASLPNLNIGNIDNIQRPTSATIAGGNTIFEFDERLKPDATAPYTRDSIIGWAPRDIQILNGLDGQDRNQLYGNASKFREVVSSQALVWQAQLFDGVLVPMVGRRKDTVESANAGDKYTFNDSGDPGNDAVNVSDPRWTLPTGIDDPRVGTRNIKFSEETGYSTTWSVVLHTPAKIREKLPFGAGISLFYNSSSNFEASGGRTDVFGNVIDSPRGETKDYGFVLNVLDDRLSLKVNWYETSVSNATLDGGGVGNLNAVYRVGLNENWGRAFANWALLGIEGFNRNFARVVPDDPTSALIDPNVQVLRYQPGPNESVAQAYKRQTDSINALLANPPPTDFATHWQIQLDQDWAGGWGTHRGANQPSSLAVTGDTESEGIEFEVVAAPTPNWNIAVNASKTTATRLNMAQSFATWVDERAEFFRGPAGQVQLWGADWGQQTVGGVWLQEFYSSYLLYRLLEGSDVPELRPWRFNVVTNYSFRDGFLKGVNVGGGYRWQDESVIGFAVANDPATGEETYDITKPFKGPTEDALDLWIGYARPLTSKINWRVQLNLRNVLGEDDFIPISVQPDGSMAVGRIPEPTIWTITNTFTF